MAQSDTALSGPASGSGGGEGHRAMFMWPVLSY